MPLHVNGTFTVDIWFMQVLIPGLLVCTEFPVVQPDGERSFC